MSVYCVYIFSRFRIFQDDKGLNYGLNMFGSTYRIADTPEIIG